MDFSYTGLLRWTLAIHTCLLRWRRTIGLHHWSPRLHVSISVRERPLVSSLLSQFRQDHWSPRYYLSSGRTIGLHFIISVQEGPLVSTLLSQFGKDHLSPRYYLSSGRTIGLLVIISVQEGPLVSTLLSQFGKDHWSPRYYLSTTVVIVRFVTSNDTIHVYFYVFLAIDTGGCVNE